MTGLGIRLYTDEDVDVRLAEQLTRLGYDVRSCRDEGNSNRQLSDDWQLRSATVHGRAIAVYNAVDYIARDHEWRQRGDEHYGILISNQLSISDLVRRTRYHLDTCTPQSQYNTVLYLPHEP